MTPKDRNLVLTKSQAACLIALQHGKESKAEIAIMMKLDLLRTNAALHALMGLGLAKRDRTTAWRVTARGKACVFDTVWALPTSVRPSPIYLIRSASRNGS